MARGLRNNKTKTIGIIIPNLISHFFSAAISGIQDAAAKQGYNVIICQTNESFGTEVNNIQMMIAQRVEGILVSISGETRSYEHFQSILSRGIPLVFFDRVCEELPASRVIVDNRDGAFKATEHLILEGCRQIAHVSGPEQLSISKSRLQGYKDALAAYNIQAREDFIRHSNLTEGDTAQQIHSLLDSPVPPDAIFAFTDLVAAQAIQIIKQRNMRVPEDIAVVGFTNTPFSPFIAPSLTTVAQPAYEMGLMAAKLLLEQISKPKEFTPQSVVVKTELIVRNSSRSQHFAPASETIPLAPAI